MSEYQNIHCPRCGSKDVECIKTPHHHVCHDCAYDGLVD